MKHLFLNYVFFITLLISCKQNLRINSYEKVPQKSIEEATVLEQFIENDLLLSKFESDLLRLSKDPKFVLEKELVRNRHVDNQIDTIKIFKFKETNIQSYKAVSEEWIIEAKIMNSEFQFSESVKIKMTKKALEKILKAKLNSDIIKVGNLEQTSVFIFKFKNDNLQEILYEGYVD